MKVISLSFIFFIFFSDLLAQNHFLFDKLSNSSCFCINKEFKDSNLTLSEKEVIVSNCIQKSYNIYQSEMYSEMIAFMNKNPSSSEYDAGLYIQEEVVKKLMENCPKFYSVAVEKSIQQSDILTSEAKSEYIKDKADLVCKCVNNITNLTQIEIDMCILTHVQENDKEVIANKNFTKDFIGYLMGTCDKYSKFAVLNKFNK